MSPSIVAINILLLVINVSLMAAKSGKYFFNESDIYGPPGERKARVIVVFSLNMTSISVF